MRAMNKYLVLALFTLLVSCKNNREALKVVTTNLHIETNAEKVFEINLSSNQSTGASWRWVNDHPNSNFILVDHNLFYKKKNGEILAGGGEIDSWCFKAKSIGSDSIVFHMKDFFEDKVYKQNIFYINVSAPSSDSI